MSQNEVIADRIEEAIGRMFYSFSEYDPKASEYSLYYNPNLYQSWFIEIYFSDIEQLDTVIGNGTCYEIHRFLSNEFDNISELKGVNRSIYFEFGNRPTNDTDYHKRHSELIEKTQRLVESNEKKDIKECHCCGHDFDKHELRGYTNNGTNAPTDGWIICPEENCNCFLTWGANYHGAEN